MSSSRDDKFSQFEEFFSIEHLYNINIVADNSTPPADYDAFIDNMPDAFRVASEIVSIDQSALHTIQELGSHATQLVEYLNHQARKIDLLVGFIIQQQDDEQNRHQGTKLGGGGLTFISEQSFAEGTFIEAKAFLNHDNHAIYCFLEVIEKEVLDNGYVYKTIFKYIRDEDRELLVKTSLQLQSKQLQALAQKRKRDKE